MQFFPAGISALGDYGGKHESGLIQIVESPGSTKIVGVATITAIPRAVAHFTW
jgi:hypothetical protein